MKRIAFVVSWFYKTFTPSNVLVIIFHICTCDDVTLVNEKSIVSWKYMKSSMKCVFNVNLQYLHKQVPIQYFSMMFNIHKHISHLIFFCWYPGGESMKSVNILRSISVTVFISNWIKYISTFNLIQNKIYCFAMEIVLQQRSRHDKGRNWPKK